MVGSNDHLQPSSGSCYATELRLRNDAKRSAEANERKSNRCACDVASKISFRTSRSSIACQIKESC